MKRILLLSIASLAMLMADFTLIGEQLTPTSAINDPVIDPVTEPTPSPANSTAKTNWGFQPFSIPADSVTVSPGGNIQAAIDSLPNGGTVRLDAGTFNVNTVISLKSNTVLEGAGRDQTTIKYIGSGINRIIQVYAPAGQPANVNVIVRDMTVDATGNGDTNAVEVWRLAENILFENMEIFGGGRSNLVAGWVDTAKHITFRNIITHDSATKHGLSMYMVIGGVIENCESYNAPYYGIDVARAKWVEVAYNHVHDTGWGTKYPGLTYGYIHNNLIENNGNIGLNFQKRDGITDEAYMQLENNIVRNSGVGAADWGDDQSPTTFAELTMLGNDFTDGNTYDKFRIRGARVLHEYGNNIGITESRIGEFNPIALTSGRPSDHGVGYTTWGNP